jgi:MATE family multidrug resistance protein
LTEFKQTVSDRIIDRYPAGSYRQAWVLSAPAILTMISQTVMWMVDAAMVGRLGSAELAAVGFGGILIWTVYSFFVGLTSAVNTFVSQADGAHDYHRSGSTMWQGVYIAAGASLVLYGFRAVVPQVLTLAAPPPAVEAMSTSYIQIRMLSAGFFLFHYTLAHFFRGIGDTMTPLKVLAVAHSLNIVGDYVLIFGKGPFPAMGVEGAAWATSMANVLAAVLFAACLFSRRIRERYDVFGQWRPRKAQLVRVLRIGLPIAVHFFLDMGSFLIFAAYVGRMGTAPLAANQIAIQILALSFMPAQGLAQAATTLMGQYIGAGKAHLAKRCAHTTLKMGLYYAGAIALLCLTVPGALVRIFNSDPEVVALGRRLLVWCAFFQIFDAVQFISDGALRGAGDTRVPMMIVVGGAWLVFLPLAWLFGTVLEGGVVGAWGGAVLYVVFISVLMFLRLERDRWRELTI